MRGPRRNRGGGGWGWNALIVQVIGKRQAVHDRARHDDLDRVVGLGKPPVERYAPLQRATAAVARAELCDL